MTRTFPAKSEIRREFKIIFNEIKNRKNQLYLIS